MQTIKAIYKDGKIELLESFGDIKSADLYIVVLPHGEEKKAYGFSGEVFQNRIMESEIHWEEAPSTNGSDSARKALSKALRQTVTPDADGFIHIQAPPGFGHRVDVIVLPVSDEEKKSDYFECTDANGITYKVNNWTDEEWGILASRSFADSEDDKNVDWEGFFDVKNR